MAGTVAFHAPKHLSPASKRLYRQLVSDYGLEGEPHALKVLQLAVEAVDRAEEARRTLAAEGTYVRDRFGQHRAHPAVAVERDSRLAAVRCFRELSLDAGEVAGADDARPPRVRQATGMVGG